MMGFDDFARKRGSTRRAWLVIGAAIALGATCTVTASARAEIVPSVSAGAVHTCAIKTDSTLACWGWNAYGQTNVPAGLGTVQQVSAGEGNTCAIRITNKTNTNNLACWGWNAYGQTSVPADIKFVRQVSAGGRHTCAISGLVSSDAPSNLICWGWNAYGQASLPIDLGMVTQVSAGARHTCAIKTDSTLACWGWNANGQTSVPADLGPVKQVSAGTSHTCAVKSNDTVACWGYDEGDDLGQAAVPADLGMVSQVSAGEGHTCAVKTNATAACWGDTQFSQATPPAGLGTVRQVSAGGAHTCAVSTNLSITCWGLNDDGQTRVPGDAFPSLSGTLVDFGDPSGLDFGDVTAGLRSPVLKSFLSSKPAIAGIPLTLGTVTVSNSGRGAFTLLPQSCSEGQVLADGSSCTIRVRFTPRIWQRGEVTGLITVTDDSPAATRTIPLTGTSLAPAAFILQNATATPAPANVDFGWETSDDSSITITIAQPVTTTVKVKQGKKTVTKTVTTIKQLPVTTIPNATAGPGAFSWNRKIGNTAAAKGTWAWVITAKSSRGTLTRTAPVTLG